MRFYDNDDYNSLRGMTIVGIVAVIISVIIAIYSHLSNLHDEKMVQMGCNEKLINNFRIWECRKDKQ